MIKGLKKIIFKTLGLKNYLHLVQYSFDLLYRTNILKQSSTYKFHYFDKRLIQKGDTIIDIGANLGYYSRLFAKWVGKKGKVYAVEPIKIYNEAFSKYTKKYSDSIILLPYALGTEEKEIELVTSLRNGSYNTGLPHVYDKNRDGEIETQDFRFKASMKIPAKLFEDIPKIDFIKCDIEGFEYVVLNNMRPVIEKHKPKVQVEVWGQNETDTINLFEDLGYITYKLEDKSLKLTKNKKVSGDYMFIHKIQCPPNY